MDLKLLAADLKSLQSRQEKYEDLVADGSGDKNHNKEMLVYYRTEAAKVRQVYLSMVQAVKHEMNKED